MIYPWGECRCRKSATRVPLANWSFTAGYIEAKRLLDIHQNEISVRFYLIIWMMITYNQNLISILRDASQIFQYVYREFLNFWVWVIMRHRFICRQCWHFLKKTGHYHLPSYRTRDNSSVFISIGFDNNHYFPKFVYSAENRVQVFLHFTMSPKATDECPKWPRR